MATDISLGGAGPRSIVHHVLVVTERDETWEEVADALHRMGVTAAEANADLLRRSADRWAGRVVARSSMHDLLFTAPGDKYPFAASVRVSWNNDTYEFRLSRQGGVVAGDKCLRPNSEVVLDAFLVQLVGGEV